MLARPTTTLLAGSLLTAGAAARQPVHAAVRRYATGPANQGGASSNLPLFLALGGVGGLGAWYALGGFGDAKKPLSADSGSSVAAAAAAALNKDEWREFTLKEVKPYNHDSRTYVFELPDGAKPGMNVASAVVVKAADDSVKDKNGKTVIRPYTPVTSPETAGHLDFLIKHYDGGLMTGHLDKLKPGDKLAIKGPIPKFPYKANEFEEIALVGGGSGITPLYQVAQAIAANPSDKTKVTLIYTNKSDKDILLREYFDELEKKDSRFKVVYGVDKLDPKAGLPEGSFEGYLTPEIGSKYLPAPGKADKVKVFICGPPPQVEALAGNKVKGQQPENLKGIFADLGYANSQIYRF